MAKFCLLSRKQICIKSKIHFTTAGETLVEFIGYLYGMLTDLFEARKLKMTTRKWLKVSLS